MFVNRYLSYWTKMCHGLKNISLNMITNMAPFDISVSANSTWNVCHVILQLVNGLLGSYESSIAQRSSIRTSNRKDIGSIRLRVVLNDALCLLPRKNSSLFNEKNLSCTTKFHPKRVLQSPRIHLVPQLLRIL